MKKIIIANWKLNPGTAKDASKLLKSYKPSKNVELIVSPPPVFLSLLKGAQLCCQAVFETADGPYLGQTSVLQLKDLKVKYALVGHSASRQFHVTPDRVKTRLSISIKHKITPVYCVGSMIKESDSVKASAEKIRKQIMSECVTADIPKIILAIEPTYAISKGKKDVHHASANAKFMGELKNMIAESFDFKAILYGGSVDHENASHFLPYFDGLLVGRSSLDPKEFNKILNFPQSGITLRVK